MATVDPLLSAYMCDTNTLEIFQADISNINQVFICVSQSEGEIKAAIQGKDDHVCERLNFSFKLCRVQNMCSFELKTRKN